MNPKIYIEQARSTAIYPGRFTYPALGLAGEIGETIDKITGLTPFKLANKDSVTKEIGDVLWYIVNTSLDIGGVAFGFTSVLGFTKLRAELVPSYDDRSPLVKLSIYAGRIAEIAKKQLRDNNGDIDLPTDKVMRVERNLNEILLCLFDIADHWDINMDDVAQVNINKLLSRKERGELGGSGDNR